MNKFQRFLSFYMKWWTIFWNMMACGIMAVWCIVALGYSEYSVLNYTPGVLWLIGGTIFVNLVNFWNRILIRIGSKTKK